MQKFIQENSVTLIIAIIGVVSTYSLYGYRISDLEKQTAANQAAIAALNTQQNQINVQLGQIQVDLTYIKASIDRLIK